MYNRNAFQYEIAVGRWTLPLVTGLLALLYLLTAQSLADGATLGIALLVSYTLIEVNTGFALIHTRTSLPSVFYLATFAGCFCLHSFAWTDCFPLLFLLLLASLFRSYESGNATVAIFHAFFLWGIGTVFIPGLLCLLPVLLFQMFLLRSMSLRTLGAALVGWLAAYWMRGVYLLATGETASLWTPFSQPIFGSIDYSVLPNYQIISIFVLLGVTTVCSLQAMGSAYKEKVQTRIFLQSVFALQIGLLLFMLLQPLHLVVLLPVQLMLGALMFGVYYAQTYNRITRYTFPLILLVILAVFLYNLWMR